MKLFKNGEVLTCLLAALASFIPLALTWQAMLVHLSARQRELMSSPFVILAVAFGTAYASNSNAYASLLAILIVGVFFTMYDDLIA